MSPLIRICQFDFVYIIIFASLVENMIYLILYLRFMTDEKYKRTEMERIYADV